MNKKRHILIGLILVVIFSGLLFFTYYKENTTPDNKGVISQKNTTLPPKKLDEISNDKSTPLFTETEQNSNISSEEDETDWLTLSKLKIGTMNAPDGPPKEPIFGLLPSLKERLVLVMLMQLTIYINHLSFVKTRLLLKLNSKRKISDF